VQIRRCPAAVSIRLRRRQSEPPARPPPTTAKRRGGEAEGLKRKTTTVLPGELARIRLIAAGGPNLQEGDLITAEPGFQAIEGRAITLIRCPVGMDWSRGEQQGGRCNEELSHC
jgi:hypothetical protein